MARPSALVDQTTFINITGSLDQQTDRNRLRSHKTWDSTPECNVFSSIFDRVRTNGVNEVEDEAETKHENFVLTTQIHKLLPLIEVGT